MSEGAWTPGARFVDALTFAVTIHERDTRKGTPIPYIGHLLTVCGLVIAAGGDEDEAIGALLHDTLEDHPETVTRDLLEQRFGGRVARIVVSCTDTPADYSGGQKPPWKERKVAYLAHMRTAGPSERLVSLADKLDNARAILRDYRALGESLWTRFKASRDEQLWFLRGIVESCRVAGETRALLDELARVIDDIEAVRSSSPA